MKNAYVITSFDIKTDIKMKYPLKYRSIYYSENELYNNINYILKDIHEEYQEISNSVISFDDFYTKFELILEVSVISLNRRKMLTGDDYKKYLDEVKQVSREDLCNYLLSFTDSCTLEYDYKLNLKSTYSHLTNEHVKADLYKQFAFSYKALFPDKYFMNKYKDGDRVLYRGEEYIIWNNKNKSYTIFESDDPLNYIIGYTLMDDDGYILNDDKWCYFPMDEDLKLLPVKEQYITDEQIERIKWYICSPYGKNNLYHISNRAEFEYFKKYNKMIRSDNYISVILKLQNGDNIEITKKDSIDLMSYTFLYNDIPVMYNIGYIKITKECDIKDIIIKYNNIEIDTITVNTKYFENDAITISKYLGNKDSSYDVIIL